MSKIIIYGSGSFSKLILHYLKNDTAHQVEAFCVDKQYINSKTFCGLPLVNIDDIKLKFPSSEYKVFVAIGYSNMRARKLMYQKIKDKGYACINYINSNSLVDDSVSIGENNAIFPNTVIEPFVKIGNNNIIWSSVNICHDVTILNHSFIAAQVVIGGRAKVFNNCFLGFNSTIVHNIKLADETLAGAKSLVLNNTQENSKYIGSPAVKIGEHSLQGIKIK